MSENEEEKRKIKVVTGDGNDLNISPVYDHIKSDIRKFDTFLIKKSL